MRWIFFSILAFGIIAFLPFQESELSKDEQELYELITQYRKENKLPKIPLSKELTKVARLHAEDLSLNDPTNKRCNAHSWSNKGHWEPCCYTSDHKNAECMWFKPKELSEYSGIGYEIVARYLNTNDPSIKMKPAEALNTWKKSPGHNNVIINKKGWKNKEWKAIGIGLFRGVAVVWFGEVEK
jgi:uncharacterized protein YkwD